VREPLTPDGVSSLNYSLRSTSNRPWSSITTLLKRSTR